MSSPAKQIYEFGQFRLEAAERMLLREGTVVPLTPKAFDTLLLLVENSGHVLTRDELLEAVWRDAFVEENTLTQNIAALRKALGERQNGPRYIETVPKTGYRFIAQVKALDYGNGEVFLERRTRERVVIEAQETVIDEAEDKWTFHRPLLLVFQRLKKGRLLGVAAVALVLLGVAALLL